MLSVLIEGTLTQAPVTRTSAKGSTYVTASMRTAGDDGEAIWCSLIAEHPIRGAVDSFFGGTSAAAERQRAQSNANGARHALLLAEQKAGQLVRQIEHLEALLSAEPRAEQARVAAAAVAEKVQAAAGQVLAAQRALATIEGLIVDEERAFDASRAAAAAQVLAAVKAGGDASKVQTATRDRLDTLAAAKADAEGELAAARTAHKAAQSKHAAAQQSIRDAEADQAALAHAIAQAAYVEASRAYLVALARARRSGVGIEDPRPAAYAAAQAECESAP